MWRRVVSLSPLVSSSKSRLLNQMQVAYGFNAWRVVYTQAEDEVSGARKPFVTSVSDSTHLEELKIIMQQIKEAIIDLTGGKNRMPGLFLAYAWFLSLLQLLHS